MKPGKLIVLLAATLFCAAASFGQTIPSDKVPEEVLSAFRNRFPDASNTIWMKKANSNYEVKFTMADLDQKAEFDGVGIWVETENRIARMELPKVVRNAVITTNPTCKIADAEEVQTADKGKVYEVGCSAKTGKMDYRVTADGTMLGEVSKK